MTRRDDFVLLVQTYAFAAPPQVAIDMLAGAMAFPEEVFAGDVLLGKMALEYCRWCSTIAPKPEWVAAWEENVKARKVEADNRVTIKINRETNAEQWWLQAESLADTMPKSCIPIVCGREEQVTVTKHDAEHFRDWGAGIPGWDDQPFHFIDSKGQPW